MTYRARNAARRLRKLRCWPMKLALAQRILKRHYSLAKLWPVGYYGIRPSVFGRGLNGRGTPGALEEICVPVTLTSIAEFNAALYWYRRGEGPDPGEYVTARHKARPYA